MNEQEKPVTVEIPTDDYWRRQINCQDACPVHTDARGYVRAVARGDLERAYLIARGPNPLASICGRVCGAPCEAACRRGSIDQPIAIRALKRFVSERFGCESSTPAVGDPRGESHPAGEVSQSAAGDDVRRPAELLERVLNRASADSGIGSSAPGDECRHTEEVASLRRILSGIEGARRDSRTSDDSRISTSGADGPKVAIIGSGPAGLAAAHDLALLGYQPTVFEMEPIPAGMLAVGIPEYRLPRDLINAEVEVIRALGVRFVCNTEVGKDISLEEIRRDHEATIIAVGAKRSRIIPIPGGEGPGVIGGVEFLRDVALQDRKGVSSPHRLETGATQKLETGATQELETGATLAELGRRIVVIGGGNVAYDVSRTVIRQTEYDVSRSALRQARVGEVHLCCLESVDEMPADDVEIIEGREEGVILHPSLGPVAIDRNEAGAVVGATFKRCLRVFDESGRFAPQFDEADQVSIAADTIVWAIGQVVDVSFVPAESDIKVTERGAIECNPDTLKTSAPDVFLAGDVAYGPRLLIDAVASGKKCARSIHAQITGTQLEAHWEFTQVDLTDYERESDYEKQPRVGMATASPAQRKTSQTVEVECGYDAPEATVEASRCLDCGVNTIFDSNLCILCGGCADVCPELCLQLVSGDRLQGEGLEELMRARYGELDVSTVSAIVKDETKCIRCALCAQRCPVGAITMERFGFKTQWAVAGA